MNPKKLTLPFQIFKILIFHGTERKPKRSYLHPHQVHGCLYRSRTDLREQSFHEIKALELELQSARTANAAYAADVTLLQGEVQRLSTFEQSQEEFQRIRTEFYEEVIYADNGPGPEEYRKYYEQIDPATAEYLYQLVVKSTNASAQMADYASAYAAMPPEEAAAIFNTMGNSLELVGEILWSMTSAQRGAILAQMDEDIAAQVTRIMDPQ